MWQKGMSDLMFPLWLSSVPSNRLPVSARSLLSAYGQRSSLSISIARGATISVIGNRATMISLVASAMRYRSLSEGGRNTSTALVPYNRPSPLFPLAIATPLPDDNLVPIKDELLMESPKQKTNRVRHAFSRLFGCFGKTFSLKSIRKCWS